MTLIRPTSTPISLVYKLRFLLIAELDAQQLTRAALAERVGFSQKHISQILNARVGLSADNADTLLRALNREWVVGTAPAFGEPTTESWRLDQGAGDTATNRPGGDS